MAEIRQKQRLIHVRRHPRKEVIKQDITKKPFNVSILLTAHANQAEGFQMEKKTLEAAAVMTLPASGHPEKVSLRWAVLPPNSECCASCVRHVPRSHLCYGLGKFCCHHPHFPSEETEARRREGISLRLASKRWIRT